MKTLLLQTCCAPCGSAVLEKIKNNYEAVLFFYNPNIMPREEHDRRLSDVRRLADIFNVRLIEPEYDNEAFLKTVKDLENEPEKGKRCELCIEMRLRKTAEAAKGFDYFTTTLSVSPHKDFNIINRVISEIDPKHGLAEDFKKADGYKRSIELSKQYGFYRQNYCGCDFIRSAP